MLKTLKKQGGFTLLELLIVIVIIGILALLIIPNVTSAPKKARDTQRKTDLRAIQKALEEYFTSANAYPVQASAATAGTALDAALSQGNPPIMKTIPSDPKSNFSYSYLSADGTSYTLTACLENGSDSGTDTAAAASYAGSGSCTTKAFVLNSQN